MKKRSDPCSKAQVLYERGDLKSSLEQIERCKKFVTKNLRESKVDGRDKIRLQLAKINHFEGLVSMQLNRISSGIKAFERSINMLDKFPSTAEISNQMAEALYTIGIGQKIQRKDPIENFQKASEYYRIAKNYEALIKSKFQELDHTSSFPDKLKMVKEIQSIGKKVKDKKTRSLLIGNATLLEAKLISRDDEEKSRKILNKAKKQFQKQAHLDRVAEVLVEFTHLKSTPIGEAEEFLREALDIANLLESPRLKGVILTELGVMYLKDSNFEKGKNHLLRGLKFRSESGDKNGAAKTLMELARITLVTAQNSENLETAINFIEQSLQLFSEGGDEYGSMSSHELAASIYTRSTDYEKAISHAKKGQKLAKKFKDSSSEARLLLQLGVAFDGKGDRFEVIPIFEKSLKLFSNLNLKSGEAEVHYLMGLHYLRVDESKARDHLHVCLAIYEKLRTSTMEFDIMYKLVKSKLEELGI